MYLVRIGELEPGQVVAKAVTNSGGAILCPPGLELTQVIIDRLEKAGIDNVAIDGGNASAETVQQRIDALQARFSDVTDPVMLELKNSMESRLRAMSPNSGS